MTVYFIALFFMFLLPLLTRNKWLAVALFGSVTWFLAAFRNLNLGLYDTTGTYYDLFVFAQSHPFDEIASSALGFENALFAFATKVIQLFTGSNYQAYIATLSLIFTGCICAALVRFAKEREWSGIQMTVACVSYFSLVYFYSFTMLRQFAALSVLVAFAYPCLERRGFAQFLVAVAFASMLHSTAMVFIISYPLCVLVPYQKGHFIVVLGLAALGTLAPRFIMTVLSSIPIPALQIRMGYIVHGIYEAETAGIGYGTLTLLVALAAFYIWRMPKGTVTSYYDLLWLISMGIVFQGWSHVIVEFYRVAMYFTVFNIFLLPERLCLVGNERLRTASMLIVMGTLLAYGLLVFADNVGVVPYSFCWDIGAWPH